MSEKQLPDEQTNHSEAPLPKKPRSKRKASSTRKARSSNKNHPALSRATNGNSTSSSIQTIDKEKEWQVLQTTPKNTSKRSNHKRATPSTPEKRPKHDLKQEETQVPVDPVADQDEVKDATFVDTFLELDAFLLEDDRVEASFSDSALAASFSSIDLDAFLLEDNAEVISPFDAVIAQDDWADAGDHKDPSLPPPTSAPTDTDSHSISNLDEDAAAADALSIVNVEDEQSLEPLLIASSSANEDVDTPQAALIDEDSDIAIREQDVLPQIIDTPLPPSLEEDQIHEIPYNVKEWYPEGEPLPKILDTPLPAYSYKHWYESRRWKVSRTVLALCLLVLSGISSILLWRNVTDTHLYVYTLDPSSGDVVIQQDIGGGYQGKTTITDPVQAGSTLVFGVRTAQTSTSVNQKILTLTGRETSWHVDNQFTAPLTSGTLSTTTDGHLVVEYANGLQLMSSNGHILWSLQGDQPTLGSHAFQPVSNHEMLYTVKSAGSGEVAAFALANGAMRWMKKLNDTFNYSPPLLLNAGILYIAGDSNLFAINAVDGSLLWQKQWAARSLFVLNNGQSSLLLAAGAQGLAAFDAASGGITWSFQGQPANKQQAGQAQGTAPTDTPAQFYQAGIDSGNKMIYATGIVWDTLQVREQLWLYAVDATTGTLRWSEPIGSDVTSADAGRVFTPLVDPDYGIVTLEQAQDNGDYSLSAFDTGTGASRWNVHFDGEIAAAPMLLRASSQALLHLKLPRGKKHLNAALANIPDTVLILPVTQSNILTALHSWSHERILLMILIALCLLGLLFLWMFPLHIWILRQQDHLHNIRHTIEHSLLYPLKLVLRFWRYSHRLFALVILLLFVGGGVLEYVHLNQLENGLYAFAGSTGNTQWQRINTSSTQTMLADTQGSIENFTVGDQSHQLSLLDRNGAVQWTTFSSEGIFAVPPVSTSPGTILVALSGPTMLHYQFAPDDPAYPHLEEHILNLYLLNYETGKILWQSNVVSPDSQQDAVVLGADTRFIYIASRERNAGPHGPEFTIQLIAVNSSTGNIEWRIFDPSEAINAPTDYGSLLLQGRMIFWQTAGTIYSIDSTLGQIQWRRSILEDDPNALPAEEPHMAEAAGVLLVERSSIYRVLNAASGNELSGIPNPDSGTVESLAGVTAVGNIFLIYGDSTVEAINATTQQIIWKQDQFDAIEGVKVSDDKKTVYVVQLNSIDQSTPTPIQAITALELKTGSVRWTFQPPNQASFINPQSDGFQYHNDTLFATICMPDPQSPCARERLYAINAATGNALWKFEAKSIFDLHVSSNGQAVFLQTRSTEWINLIGRFRS